MSENYSPNRKSVKSLREGGVPFKKKNPDIIPFICFVGPALLFFIFFYGIPFFMGFSLSFVKWSGFANEKIFCGIRNYLNIFRDPQFWNSLKITLSAAVLSVLMQLPLALLLASLLEKQSKVNKILQSIFFIPQMLSLAIIAILWQMIFEPNYGPLSLLLKALELPPVDWLGRPETALWSLMIVSTWAFFGYHMVLQLAGLSSIPTELIESARLETDNNFIIFFKIKLPLLKETIFISSFMMITGAFAYLMSLFMVMTGGGPIRSTELLGIYMYKKAFSSYQIGQANAVAMIMVLFMGLMIFVLLRFTSRRKVEY